MATCRRIWSLFPSFPHLGDGKLGNTRQAHQNSRLPVSQAPTEICRRGKQESAGRRRDSGRVRRVCESQLITFRLLGAPGTKSASGGRS